MTSELAVGDADRDQRTRLAATMRRFLRSEISAFDFDEALDEFRDSQDPVVRFVVLQAWFLYDDCRDHLVALSQEAWNFMQRLLLLLSSNCYLETRTESRRAEKDHYASILYPFATFRDVRIAFQSSDFVRMPYPREIGSRRIRSRIEQLSLAALFWLFLAPLSLPLLLRNRKLSTTYARCH